jgi:hypothetical protein
MFARSDLWNENEADQLRGSGIFQLSALLEDFFVKMQYQSFFSPLHQGFWTSVEGIWEA